MRPDCKALAAALDGFGALWRWGDFYGNPACDGAAEYIAVLDEPTFDGSDDGELTCCRHSVALELYDNGGRAAEARRRELSRLLVASGFKHKRAGSVHIPSERKHMTAYYLNGWIEEGEADGRDHRD